VTSSAAEALTSYLSKIINNIDVFDNIDIIDSVGWSRPPLVSLPMRITTTKRRFKSQMAAFGLSTVVLYVCTVSQFMEFVAVLCCSCNTAWRNAGVVLN